MVQLSARTLSSKAEFDDKVGYLGQNMGPSYRERARQIGNCFMFVLDSVELDLNSES